MKFVFNLLMEKWKIGNQKSAKQIIEAHVETPIVFCNVFCYNFNFCFDGFYCFNDDYGLYNPQTNTCTTHQFKKQSVHVVLALVSLRIENESLYPWIMDHAIHADRQI